MPRDPLAWQPLLRHWTHCLGEGGSAIARLGDLEAVPDLDLAALLPGGPGWADVQRCLRHDPDGTFRTLYYGLALRGLEALPAPALLAEPESQERPRVSVLIPVHNHWPITLNALRSLAVMANSTPFEVILADDASTDATIQLGHQLPWLRVWRSEHNQGFLDTCNAAAAQVRGDALLLLNNDVLVGDYALDRLADTFVRHPEAGVVGAAMWSAEGRPQEVGGIVWADGAVWNHGRNTPLEHRFALDYERQCDYVSGCALAIRSQLWAELDGFDPRYCPAYAEDTDLCLRVRKAGKTVWVQPEARVLHLEGLSHSRSTDRGLKAHQLRNLEQLKHQWQFTLDTEHPPTDHPLLLSADRGLLGRPLALLLHPRPEVIAACRQKGYGVLALGESPQLDVLGLPLGWTDLERWLLEQLPDRGPEVVMVGDLDAAGTLAVRLHHARPHWSLVARPSELPPQAVVFRSPAIPGWESEDLRILASSSGLHADGWLEAPSRLVIELLDTKLPNILLQLEVYQPSEGAEGELMFQISNDRALDIASVSICKGLNRIDLPQVPAGAPFLVIDVDGHPIDLPVDSPEQRRLLVILHSVKIIIPNDLEGQ